MNDKELLVLAAKAAGYDVFPLPWDASDFCRYLDETDENGERYHSLWNPLNNDGDALRLAVRLKMDISHGSNFDGGSPWVSVRAQGQQMCIVNEFNSELFRERQTRHAIVLAAADIVVKMP